LVLQWLPGFWRLGPQGWVDAARAAVMLYSARHRLNRGATNSPALYKVSGGANATELDPSQLVLVERVRTIVPRVANRIGWPDDCLIQAVAAQVWLGRAGISSQIVFGARARSAEGFDAHAWLLVGAREVTGWNNREASSYVRFPQRPTQAGFNNDI
jgi:hypothetical protein